MNKTIGLFAHVDAGKTTFAESLLYITNTLKKRGRVDHQDTLLDHHEIEKQRGITIFSDIAKFQYAGSTYFLVDTPGHVDFSCEMEKVIAIMDAAIVIISGTDGPQAHTATVWKLLRQANIPTLIFINKMDREGIKLESVISQIKSELSPNCYLLEENTQTYIEQLAELDETLLETYLTSGYDESLWCLQERDLFLKGDVFPIFYGSALQNTGVSYLIQQLDSLLEITYDEKAPFSGRVFQTRYDELGDKITYIKALSGALNVRELLPYGQENQSDKVNQIRVYSGPKYEQINRVVAGEIVGVTGLTEAKIGDGVGLLKDAYHPRLIPTLRVQVLYPESIHAKELLKLLKQLEVENPMLAISVEEETGAIQIAVMGLIQLEVLKELFKRRFNVILDFGPCEIIYQETIQNVVVGRGHYEPLKHYAEVHVRLEPLPRGSGIIFESELHIEELPLSYQNLVQTHVFERQHKGVLTGSTLTDVKIILIAGAAHERHTSGGDFREATYRAIRQALEKADNILLEPYYEFEIRVELDLLGRVLHDVQLAKGVFETPETSEHQAIIKGIVPVVNFMDYQIELMSYSKGRGRMSLQVKGYDKSHNSTDVIKKINYDKESDRLNPSGSIFCAKGSGFVVPWDESDNFMHC